MKADAKPARSRVGDPGPQIGGWSSSHPWSAHWACPCHLPWKGAVRQFPDPRDLCCLLAVWSGGGDLASLSQTPRCPPALVESSHRFHTCGHIIWIIFEIIAALAEHMTGPSCRLLLEGSGERMKVSYRAVVDSGSAQPGTPRPGSSHQSCALQTCGQVPRDQASLEPRAE